MPKTRNDVVQKVMDAFMPTEHSAIETADRAARCIASLIEQRGRARVHPKTGGQALVHIANGLASALVAANEFAAAHEELAKLPAELGIEVGLGADCEPNSAQIDDRKLRVVNAA